LLLLENGYVLHGMSAPADAANFDAELGKRFSLEDALRKMWPLEGYLLRDKLYRQAIADKEFDGAGYGKLDGVTGE
jgi:hypothetical protein